MRLPNLPETVRIVPASCKNEKGVPVEGAPVFVLRPLGALESAELGPGLTTNPTLTYAECALERLVRVEGLAIGADEVPFDKTVPAHVAALEPRWLPELGHDLVNRTWLSEEELGKSPLPSGSQ